MTRFRRPGQWPITVEINDSCSWLSNERTSLRFWTYFPSRGHKEMGLNFIRSTVTLRKNTGSQQIASSRQVLIETMGQFSVQKCSEVFIESTDRRRFAMECDLRSS